jgi:hypothetical protein
MLGHDVRALLREGDNRMRASDFRAAAHAYARAARIFEAQQQPLKAVAVLKQLREVVARHAPEEVGLDDEARMRLPDLYRALGLEQEAVAVEREQQRR